MPDLKTLLDSPVSWMSAATDPDVREFLEDLQANILKSHGRHHAAHMFLSFEKMSPDAVAALLRTLGRYCTSAYAQLRTNRRYPPHLDGGPVRCLFLSARGYEKLGKHGTLPAGNAFKAGMAARSSRSDPQKNILNDPPRSEWDPVGWRDHVPDAMFLVADADADAVTRDLEQIEGWLNGTAARILTIERGLQQTRQFRQGEKAEAVEHFGYVDGRSQPLFLAEDLDAEKASVAEEVQDPKFEKPGDIWSAAFKPSQFIVADPNGRRKRSAGSYFVFRKLEQDVRGFNAAEDKLGDELFGSNATQDQLDRAGAMVVGRFEDGTPLLRGDHELRGAVPNGFVYSGDPDAKVCPFHAHIRKVNPRGDVQRAFGAPDDSGDRKPIMARRGITYGAKRPMSADGSEFADKGKEPVHDSGLLFMAYMASLEDQFEFTQHSWANNPKFAGNLAPTSDRPQTGVDPIMGQAAAASERKHTYLDGRTDNAVAKELSFDQFVHMKGGEYFFAPSLSFLHAVGL